MKAIITETYLQNIANAIRSKNGSNATYTPPEMANAISGITGLGGQVVDFEAMNTNVKNYLQNVTYTDANYGTTQITSYLPSSGDFTKEDPVGYALTLAQDGTLYIQDETDWSVPVQSYTVTAGTFTVYNLVPGHINRWYLVRYGTVIATGRLRATGQVRMIYTDSLHNFRDLGGWECEGGQIKYGKIIRGGEGNGVYNVEASAADIVRLRNLGIKQEIDMRNASETAQTDEDETNDITSSFLGDDVYYDWLPNSVGTSMLTPGTTQYTNFVAELEIVIDRAIHGLPVYLHCQGGADRTGVTAMMLEALLGVSKSDISKDYELTSMYTVAGSMVGRYVTDERWLAWLNILDSYTGSTLQEKTVAWFLEAGFAQDTLDLFQTAMVEEVSADVAVTGITITGGVSPIYSGGQHMTLVAIVTPSNATSQIVWSSNNTSVATVSEGGVVTTVSPGSATITASADGVSATYSMTVLDLANDPNLLHRAVDSSNALYNGGTGYKLGYRLNSSGGETAVSGGCVTGFMPVQENDNIVLTGISGLYCADSSQSTYVRIAAFDSTFTQLWNKDIYAASTKLTPITTDGSELTSFTLVSSSSYPCANIAYIRLSARNTAADAMTAASTITVSGVTS